MGHPPKKETPEIPEDDGHIKDGAMNVVKPRANMICAARRVGNKPPLNGHHLDRKAVPKFMGK
jgi:hypothetical protein